MFRSGFYFWLALGVAVLCGSLAERARAESPYIYGIHWFGEAGLGDVEQMTNGLPVWTLETVTLYSAPWWQFSGQEANFRAIHGRGHSLIIRIQPDWGLSIPKTAAEREQFLNDLVPQIEAAKDYCRIWQIGNEMNLYDEYDGEVLTPQDYAAFYKDIREAIHRVESPLGEQIVLVGPVSPGGVIGGVRHTAGNQYLREMCEALNPEDVDGFSLHAYGSPFLDGLGATSDFMGSVAAQLDIIDNEGFCDKPAFITEWNRQTNPADNASEEAKSAVFLREAFKQLNDWNNVEGNHPIVAACWFIYRDDPGWRNYSIRYLKDVNPRGADQDLWDAFQDAAKQNYAAGSMNPDPCAIDPTPTPTPNEDLEIEREQAPTPGELSTLPDSEDAINGRVGTTLTGGFHNVNTDPADQVPAFSDGAGLGRLTGLLRDFPGRDTPAWSGYWMIDESGPADVYEVRVFSGNADADGRVFHHYDVYATADSSPRIASSWTLVAEGILSDELETTNSGDIQATRTSVRGKGGAAIATSVRAMRFDFYAASDTTAKLIDQFDGGETRDQDGDPPAFVSPLIYEVDVYTASEEVSRFESFIVR